MNNVKNIYHFHVQKTGGSSINKAFEKISKGLGKKYVRWSSPDILNKKNVFYAHQHISIRSTPSHTLAITVLREPVSRLFSRYRHILWLAKGWKNGSKTHKNLSSLYGEVLKRDFEWFLKTAPEREIQHILTVFGKNFEKALKNIENHIDFILFQDTLQHDFNILCEKINITPFELPKAKYFREEILWEPTERDFELAKSRTQEEQKVWSEVQKWRKK